MKHHILPLLFLLPLTATAQGIHLKFGGGLSSHYGSDQVIGAFKIGIGYEVELTQHWSFTPGIEVYGKGAKIPTKPPTCSTPTTTSSTTPTQASPSQASSTAPPPKTTSKYPSSSATTCAQHPQATSSSAQAPIWPTASVANKNQRRHPAERFAALLLRAKTFNEPGTHRFDCGVQTYLGYQFPSSVSVGLEADWGIAKFNTAGRRNVSALIALGYKF